MKGVTWLEGRLGAVAPDEEADSQIQTTRRSALLGVSILALAGGLGTPALLASDRARAHVATGSLSIDGDSITTDNGQLESLSVSMDGHVSYDGLDQPADTIDVNLHAAPTGGATDAARNQIASQTFEVALESGLNTHAGHRDYTFADVDVLAADDLTRQDFSAAADGTTQQTDVDFRASLAVKDADGNTFVEASTTDTATIQVTNQERSSASGGNGQTNAGGTNQSPG